MVLYKLSHLLAMCLWESYLASTRKKSNIYNFNIKNKKAVVAREEEMRYLVQRVQSLSFAR